MIPEQELRHMCNDQKTSQREIAEKIGVSQSTISKWMKLYEIKSPTAYESRLIRSSILSKEKLYNMYWMKKMSQLEIAKEVGVTHMTVSNWMKKHRIGSRTVSESKLMESRMPSREKLHDMYRVQGISQQEIAKKIGVVQSAVFNWMKEYEIESRTISEAELHGISMPSKNKLHDMYWVQNMSQLEIAEEIMVVPSTVSNWMKEYEIETRAPSDFTGENASQWNGGTSFEPYCKRFNNTFKEAVRARDDFTCQLCGFEQNSQRLDVHHIHYDKENCYPDVVALCRSCNGKVNSNRNYWEEYFENQLLERGLYCWSMSQEA